MSDKPEMPIKYHIGAADLASPFALNVVRPGDTLIINCQGPMTAQQAADIKAQAAAAIPEGIKVLVFANGLQVTIARSTERDGTIEGDQP